MANGDEANGSGHGASSRAFRNDDGGVANSSGSWIGPSTTSSKREFFLAGCWTGDGAENITVDDGDAWENGVGVGDADSVGVADGDAEGNGDGVGVRIGVGIGVVVGIGFGVRTGDGVGDADTVGDGEGRSTTGASVGCVSAVLVDFSFAAGAGVRIDPGSDQPPTFSPLTKVVCKRV